jgi:transketolase N-terminal domain/subunit
MTQISAGLDGFATGIGSDGQVYMRLGVDKETPEGNAWSALTVASTVHTGERFRQVSRGVC